MKRVSGFFGSDGRHFVVEIEPGKYPRLQVGANASAKPLADQAAALAVAISRHISCMGTGNSISLTSRNLRAVNGDWLLTFREGKGADQGSLRVILGSSAMCTPSTSALFSAGTLVGLVKGLVAFAAEQGVSISAYARFDTGRSGLSAGK